MSEMKVNRSADEIETHLNQTQAQMMEHQKNGNYIEAENLRVTAEQLKKDLETRRVYEMEMRQNQEHGDLTRQQEEEMRTFNAFWDKKMNDYESEGNKMANDLEGKHQQDLENLRNQMEKDLPYRVKESSEFLNLKKMEEHMAKQKL